MPNQVNIDTLSLNNHTFTISGNNVYVNSMIVGQPFISGVAPSTNSLTIPISINTYGGLDLLMGRPAGWLNWTISGVSYKIPFYNP